MYGNSASKSNPIGFGSSAANHAFSVFPTFDGLNENSSAKNVSGLASLRDLESSTNSSAQVDNTMFDFASGAGDENAASHYSIAAAALRNVFDMTAQEGIDPAWGSVGSVAKK